MRADGVGTMEAELTVRQQAARLAWTRGGPPYSPGRKGCAGRVLIEWPGKGSIWLDDDLVAVVH